MLVGLVCGFQFEYRFAEREKFESEFKADIAALMDGVTPAEVEILEIRSASVVVTFAINAATVCMSRTTNCYV
jgi:hypothetical protein